MQIQTDYKIFFDKNEKEQILTFLSKFAERNIAFNFRIEMVLYNIFYVTHNFTHEFAQKYNILLMLYYYLDRHDEINLTDEEMKDLELVLSNLIDIIENSGNSILPDVGLNGKDDALIEFVQLLHGIDSQNIIRDISEITSDDILKDIVYFRLIKDDLVYYHNKLSCAIQNL